MLKHSAKFKQFRPSRTVAQPRASLQSTQILLISQGCCVSAAGCQRLEGRAGQESLTMCHVSYHPPQPADGKGGVTTPPIPRDGFSSAESLGMVALGSWPHSAATAGFVSPFKTSPLGLVRHRLRAHPCPVLQKQRWGASKSNRNQRASTGP